MLNCGETHQTFWSVKVIGVPSGAWGHVPPGVSGLNNNRKRERKRRKGEKERKREERRK